MSACAARCRRPRAFVGPLIAGSLAGCATAGAPAGPATPAPELTRLPAGATLIGLGGGDLEGVMGQPALVRAEGAAQYWRYGLAGCQLDLFLYADPKTGSARVAYLDVRPALGAAPAAAQSCAHLARRLRAGAEPPLPGPAISTPL